jgi:pilus assembly protein Flp/PilA
MRDRSTAAKGLFRAEEGATMVEYGLLVALLSVACIVILSLLGTAMKDSFTTIRDALQIPPPSSVVTGREWR